MANDGRSAERILRLPRVLDARGVGRSTHYNDVASGLYTKPVRIGQRSCGWPASEVDALVKARIAGRSNDEIKSLVKRLEAKRAQAADEMVAA